jgi:hypothetical protein
MNKEFVPYELAVKLKELGFVDECMAYYTISLTEVEHKEDGTTGPFGWKKGEVFFEKRFVVPLASPCPSNEKRNKRSDGRLSWLQ